jgi:lincosamide nucleotidyltransferase A/C/D/E
MIDGVMTAAQVIEVLTTLRQANVTAWVDGGWGVDALLGEQTREHDDLDLVVRAEAVSVIRRLLEAAGFAVERDWLPTALSLRHEDGRAIDLHPVESSLDGGGDQIQLDGVHRWHYSAPVRGSIGENPVLCCSPECQLAAHLGYQPDRNDHADMALLAQRFGLIPPVPYRQPY